MLHKAQPGGGGGGANKLPNTTLKEVKRTGNFELFWDTPFEI